jgi:hypothetical protein
LAAINKYEEIIWKVRTGYLAILYAGLTFLVGNADISKVENLRKLPQDNTASLTILFLIVGFSLSAFMVDFSYLRKKMRVTVIRDLLMEYSYNPECKITREKMYKLLQVAAERDLDEDFDDGPEKYRNKVRWNLAWILLPIYAVTPLLAFSLGLMYRLLNCKGVWKCP